MGVGPIKPAERPYERPVDRIDILSHNKVGDGHDDAALPETTLQGERPGAFAYVWEGGVDVAGVFVPSLRNFNRHLTRETLDQDQSGFQVLSAVTMGFPLVPRFSHQAYTFAVANWPSGADHTALNAWIWQAAWSYGEINANRDRLTLAPTEREMENALTANKVGVQLSIEGGFPFDAAERDIPSLVNFLHDHADRLPANFPLPTTLELSTTGPGVALQARVDACQARVTTLERTLHDRPGATDVAAALALARHDLDSATCDLHDQQRLGLLTYARRIGTVSVGLSHLVSSCFAGGGPWPSKGEGLSEDGRHMLRQMDSLGLLTDLAHAAPAAQRDVVGMVKRGELTMPVIVSHGLLPVTGKEPAWRVTEPEVLDVIKQTGGIFNVIGARAHLAHGGWNFFDVLDWLLLWPFRLFGLDWHFPGWTNPMAFIDDMIDQMDYVRKRIGIDYIGLGLDGDGFVGMPFKDYGEMHKVIRQRMKERGYSDTDIDKVFCGNYLHTLQRRDQLMAAREQQTPAPPAATALPSAGAALRPTAAAGVSARDGRVRPAVVDA